MRKHLHSFIAVACLMGIAPLIHAQPYNPYAPMSPAERFDAESQQAMALYKEDQKLCDEGPDSASRMQCKRDAKAEFDKAIAAARSRPASAGYPGQVQPVQAQQAPVQSFPVQAACFDCGQVAAVYQTEKKGESNALGALAGAVAGGVLGHQVGNGRGNSLATAAGAVGGAFAGNEIGKSLNAQKVWIVTVAYPDGRKANFEFANAPTFRVGDTVRNYGQTIVSY